MAKKKRREPSSTGIRSGASESKEAKELIRYAFQLARILGIEKVLVRADLVTDIDVVRKSRHEERIVWITNDRDWKRDSRDNVVFVPDLRLSRISQIKLGLFTAVLRQYVRIDESIISLSGTAGSKRIDTLVIANPKRDFPWLRGEDVRDVEATSGVTDVLEAALRVALSIAEKGYEGKPVGTILVVGDAKRITPHVQQLILNPLEGHPEKLRSIYSPDFLDTMRELAALDGAFVVDEKGTVQSAATYLDAPTSGVRLRAGLGARHMAAAALTKKTQLLAVVVSQSTGAVSVFRGGKIVLELEKPAPQPQRRRSP